jgi:hypothetical protein
MAAPAYASNASPLDWFISPDAGAAAAAVPMRESSNSPSLSVSTESTDRDGPSRGRMYGSYETSV